MVALVVKKPDMVATVEGSTAMEEALEAVTLLMRIRLVGVTALKNMMKMLRMDPLRMRVVGHRPQLEKPSLSNRRSPRKLLLTS